VVAERPAGPVIRDNPNAVNHVTRRGGYFDDNNTLTITPGEPPGKPPPFEPMPEPPAPQPALPPGGPPAHLANQADAVNEDAAQ
jgi:hypothetical protein